MLIMSLSYFITTVKIGGDNVWNPKNLLKSVSQTSLTVSNFNKVKSEKLKFQ